jgi:cardiolipin synthase
MNIGREYRYVWHDLMMELHGPVVDVLREEFERAWAHAGPFGDAGLVLSTLQSRDSNSEDVGYPVRVLHTRPGDAEIFRAQRAAIRNARKYIYIQNAYFTDDAMLYELAKARVFDGWACLGSANWDKLSFRTNKELNIATSHPPYVDGLLEEIFAPDFAQSVELTEPFPVRWSDHLMEVVADYLL